MKLRKEFVFFVVGFAPLKVCAIVGGRQADPHEYPFIAHLSIDDFSSCAGSIISSNTILTAAHCVDGAMQITVLAGAHNLTASDSEEPGRQYRLVMPQMVTIHEHYSTSSKHNDIALISLSSHPLTLGNTVMAIPRTTAEPPVGSYVKAVGWGKTQTTSFHFSDVLKIVDDFHLIDDGLCEAALHHSCDPKMMCVMSDSASGTCHGDAGAPIFKGNTLDNYELVGLASFTNNLGCEGNYPDMTSSINDYNNWIDANTVELRKRQ